MSTLSCGGGISSLPATAEGFSKIEQSLKNKFGENAYYTDISLSYDKSVGNIVGVTVTEDPESLTMEQWNQMKDFWKQNSEISLEVPEGYKASDFMYQLDGKISLTELGRLVEKSKNKLKSEENQKEPTLKLAYILFPENGNILKTEYFVNLQPEKGGNTFRFQYDINGNLIKME